MPMMKRTKGAIIHSVIALLFVTLFLSVKIPVYAGGTYQNEFNSIEFICRSHSSAIRDDGTIAPGYEIELSTDSINKIYGGLAYKYNAGDISVEWNIGGKSVVYDISNTTWNEAKRYTIKGEDCGKEIRFGTATLRNDTEYNNMSPEGILRVNTCELTATMDANGKLVVKGKTDYVNGFSDIWIGSIRLPANKYKDFTATVDMTKRPPGYYNVSAYLSISTCPQITVGQPILNPIREKPAVKASAFKTYPKYLTFEPYKVSTAGYDGVFIDVNGKTYGPLQSNLAKVSKLKANKNYTVYAYFGKTVSHNGKSTLLKGPKSKVSLKTGQNKKPAVKSVNISNVKLKTVKVKGKWYTDSKGNWQYLNPRTVKKTTFTVTVTLKKKPGLKGMLICGKKVQGNKKVYSTTITLDGNKQGKMTSVSVQGIGNKTYGQFTKVYKKKVRIR